MSEILEGGCLCGRIRYRAEGSPRWVGHCHCSMCRRASGAPYITWFSVKSENFRWTRGEPKVHVSSAKAKRLFCPDCGSQLAFQFNDKPYLADITAGSLDDPSLVVPKENIYWESRVPGHLRVVDLPERKIEG